MNEQALLLGRDRTLVSVMTPPADGSDLATAVLLLNSGIVHRVGPVRLYVRLARSLASKGFTVLRFDGSGIGDSMARQDNLPHEQSSVLETREVMDYLATERDIQKFVLMGICSGAVTSFKTACEDPRVTGIVMMNARGFDSSVEWNTHVEKRGDFRDYRKKIFSLQSWKRILTGKSQYSRFLGLLAFRIRNLFGAEEKIAEVADKLASEFEGLIQRRVNLLMLMSADDYSIDYLDTAMGGQSGQLLSSGLVQQVQLPDSDHTFTCLGHQEQVLQAIESWTQRSGCHAHREA